MFASWTSEIRLSLVYLVIPKLIWLDGWMTYILQHKESQKIKYLMIDLLSGQK